MSVYCSFIQWIIYKNLPDPLISFNMEMIKIVLLSLAVVLVAYTNASTIPRDPIPIPRYPDEVVIVNLRKYFQHLANKFYCIVWTSLYLQYWLRFRRVV